MKSGRGLAHLHQHAGRHVRMLRLGDGCDSWLRLIRLRPRKINDARGGQSTRARTTEQQLGGGGDGC